LATDYLSGIWQLQAARDVDGLVYLLKSRSSAIRLRAAVALRMIADPAVVPALLDALDSESDGDVRRALLATIAGLQETRWGARPSHDALGALVRALHEGTESQRVEAALSLGDRGDARASEDLLAIVHDNGASTHLRYTCAEALLKLQAPTVEVTLLGALRHMNWHIRRNGAAILGQMRATWAVEPLTYALFDEHPHVRRTSFAALKMIDTREARYVLNTIRKAKRRRQEMQLAAPPAPDDGLLRRVEGQGRSARASQEMDRRALHETPTQPLRADRLPPEPPVRPNPSVDRRAT
jgi:HEAT repeat protein